MKGRDGLGQAAFSLLACIAHDRGHTCRYSALEPFHLSASFVTLSSCHAGKVRSKQRISTTTTKVAVRERKTVKQRERERERDVAG